MVTKHLLGEAESKYNSQQSGIYNLDDFNRELKNYFMELNSITSFQVNLISTTLLESFTISNSEYYGGFNCNTLREA
jgi:hypothetical protein